MSLETEYNTFVFKGELKPTTGENPLVEPFCGVESEAWSRGHALRNLNKLEAFVIDCADGNIAEGEIKGHAIELADQLGFG